MEIYIENDYFIDSDCYYAEDVGGSIINARIDILFATHEEALAFGVQKKTITVDESGVKK